MTIGVIGRKAGMTRVFTEDGHSIPVTVIEVTPNRVTQIKTDATDGYCAVQVAFGSRKASRIPRPQAGHFSKAGVDAAESLREFRIADPGTLKVGDSLDASVFEAGQKIDVTGTSKGKGFQGAVKRHNFQTQDATHGNSLAHRAPGSIGQCQTPGRVWKGKKMAGHMGAERVTVQTLEVVRVDFERNLLLVKGAVPGANTGQLIVKPATKA